MTATNVPPHDLPAERAVLSALLLDAPSHADGVRSLLGTGDFYAPDHQHVWRAICEVRDASEPVDAVTVAKRLRGLVAAPVPLLAELCDATPCVANVEAHAAIVRDLAHVRRVIAHCQTTAAQGYGGGADPGAYLETAATTLGRVLERRTKGRLVSLRDSLVEAFEALKRAADRRGAVSGLSTGFAHLDAQTSGLHPGNLWVVAGRPGMGKTAFAGALAVNATADSNHAEQAATLFVSLEMTHEEISQRMAACEASVSVQDARAGRLGPQSWQSLTQAAQWLADQPVAFYDQPATLDDVRAAARRYKREVEVTRGHDGRARRLALVVVDYLQLVKHVGRREANREEQISAISRGLKEIAKELGVAVVALSQLNRGCEARADKRPMLSDLRESGEIEQAADLVVFLYRDEYYAKEKSQWPGTCEVILAKQRNGPTGTVRLAFDDRYTRFRSLELHDVDGRAAAE